MKRRFYPLPNYTNYQCSNICQIGDAMESQMWKRSMHFSFINVGLALDYNHTCWKAIMRSWLKHTYLEVENEYWRKLKVFNCEVVNTKLIWMEYAHIRSSLHNIIRTNSSFLNIPLLFLKHEVKCLTKMKL